MNALTEAKERVTIPDLWRHFNLPGQPKKSCRSPFRPDKRASFSVYDDGRRWKDHATGDSGNQIAFLEKCTGLTGGAACKAFIEFAGTGRIVNTITRPAPRAPEREHRDKPDLPVMDCGTTAQLKVLATLRNIGVEGLRIANERGLLWFATLKGHPAWIVTDSQRCNAQACRMNGQPWTHLENPAKAWTLPRCRASWPIGIVEAQPFPIIALVEGGPDFLTAFHFAWAEGRERDVAPVCITGASNRIPDDAVPYFAGKRVRIFPHLDDAGKEAARRWTAQLESVNATVDCFDLSGIPTVSNGRVADLNDLSSLDADAFESDRELWSVLP
jgi:hypothetical protein